MPFIKVGERLINPALVGRVDRDPTSGEVTLFFVVPVGHQIQQGGTAYGLTTHMTLKLAGRDADDCWAELQKL